MNSSASEKWREGVFLILDVWDVLNLLIDEGVGVAKEVPAREIKEQVTDYILQFFARGFWLFSF